MSLTREIPTGDLEDKTATLTLDGAEEADRWLRDNGMYLELLEIKKKTSYYATFCIRRCFTNE